NGEDKENTDGPDPCYCRFRFTRELCVHIICFEYTKRVQKTDSAEEPRKGTENGQVCPRSDHCKYGVILSSRGRNHTCIRWGAGRQPGDCFGHSWCPEQFESSEYPIS